MKTGLGDILTTLDCGAGEYNATAKQCVCTPGHAGKSCEFIDRVLCFDNGNVNVRSDGKLGTPPCTCEDSLATAGDYCQCVTGLSTAFNFTAGDECGYCEAGWFGKQCLFSNKLTCNSRGVVSDAGVCTCNKGEDGAPVAAGRRCQFPRAICSGGGTVFAESCNSTLPDCPGGEKSVCRCPVGFAGETCDKCAKNVDPQSFPLCDKCSKQFEETSFPSCDIHKCSEFGTLQDEIEKPCQCSKGWIGRRCQCFAPSGTTGDDGEPIGCTRCSKKDIAYILQGGQDELGGMCIRPTTTQTTSTTTTTVDGNFPFRIRFPLQPPVDGTLADVTDVRLIPAETVATLRASLKDFVAQELFTTSDRVAMFLLNRMLGQKQSGRIRKRGVEQTTMFVEIRGTMPQDKSSKLIHLGRKWDASDSAKTTKFGLGNPKITTDAADRVAASASAACTASPRDLCARVGGVYQQLQCDGDALLDHVCLGDTFVSVTYGNNLCADNVAVPELFYTPAMCEVDQKSFESSVLPSRRYTTVAINESCGSSFTNIGSCGLCGEAAFALGCTADITCNSTVTAGISTTPNCVIDADTNPSFYAALSLAPEDTRKVCAGTDYGCQPSDVRYNVADCDERIGLDAVVGIIVVLVSGAVLLMVFAARYLSTKKALHLPWYVEATTFACTLDLISDITYISTETFATATLFAFAMLFILLPFTPPSAYFFWQGYQIVTYENLAWRWETGKDWAHTLYKEAKFELEGQTLLLICVCTLGIYPLAVAVVCLVACIAPFLPLPVFILWQPLRLGLINTRDSLQWAWDKTEGDEKSPGLTRKYIQAKGGLFGMIFMVTFGSVVALCLAILVTVATTVITIALPFTYAVFVCFRLFIIAPVTWMWLREVSGKFLDDIQKPTTNALFSWDVIPDDKKNKEEKKKQVDTMLNQLYGLTSEQEQLKRMCYMLAGTLVFEFFLETVPQLIVQGVNNGERDSWTAFTVMSFVISLGVGMDTVYRIGNDVFYNDKEFGSVQMMLGLDESETKEKLRNLDGEEKERISSKVDYATSGTRRRKGKGKGAMYKASPPKQTTIEFGFDAGMSTVHNPAFGENDELNNYDELAVPCAADYADGEEPTRQRTDYGDNDLYSNEVPHDTDEDVDGPSSRGDDYMDVGAKSEPEMFGGFDNGVLQLDNDGDQEA